MSSSPPTPSTDSPRLGDRNYWATFKDPPIRWCGDLSAPVEIGMERVFDFTRRILEAAEREQVMHVLETQGPCAFKFREGWTWYDHVRDLFERRGDIDLFPSGGGPTRTSYGQDRLPARLAFYRGTSIVEEDVEDPGLLLRELQRERVPLGGFHISRYSVSPLVLRGSSRTGDDW